MNFDDGPWTKCVLGLKGDTSMPVFHRRRTSRCKYEVKLTEKKNDWAKEMVLFYFKSDRDGIEMSQQCTQESRNN